MREIKCEKCGQKIKQPKPDLEIGQKLYACLGWDNNRIKIHEVAEGTNKKSIRLKCFEEDGTYWHSTGFGYKDIGEQLFFTEKEARENPYDGVNR